VAPRLEPEAVVPRHVAVIMDGNGRWAARRALPRHLGHRAGVKAVKAVVEGCARRGVGTLTLFAFSSENFGRPAEEIERLMELFVEAMDREVADLEANGIQLAFIGDLSALRPELEARMHAVAGRTAQGSRMRLNVAIAYGGRWDIVNAVRRLAARCAAGQLAAEAIDESMIAAELELGANCDPDLFIRTGGERRISNFLLWNLAYTELYFCDTLWPDFDDRELETAFRHFARRERRFGLTSAQVNHG
jgi:undecaprenyl diphosphate synthase